MSQEAFSLWRRLSPEARQKLQEYNLALGGAASELERLRLARGTLDEVLTDPEAKPMVAVLIKEVPGLVHFVLEQVLPIILDGLRPYLSIDGMPVEDTRLILDIAFGPTATTPSGQREILELVQQFGEQLLLGESSTTTTL